MKTTHAILSFALRSDIAVLKRCCPVIVAIATLLVGQAAIAASGQWEFTGSLNNARTGHTATLLADGKVLVVGGSNDGTYLASAELYDPATGTWSLTGSLNTGRTLHSATLLPDGKVLVAGGSNPSSLKTAELYDPATGTWSYTRNLGNPRSNHAAVLLLDGRVLVVGPTQTAELYDPATGKWSLTGSMSSPRNYIRNAAAVLPDGTVLVSGGRGIHEEGEPGGQIYHPDTGTWTSGGPGSIWDHTVTLLSNGMALAAAGFTAECSCSGCCSYFTEDEAWLYNATTGTTTATGSLNVARYLHTATLLPDGRLMVAGGVNDDSLLASAELYDSVSGTWSVTGSLNTARLAHTATLLQNGMVLVTGGSTSEFSGGGEMASCELYDAGTVAATTIKGAGFIDGQGDQASFSVRATLSGGQVKGSFSFSDPAAGLTITDTPIRRLSISGNTATFNGRADLGGGTKATFNVSAADNGLGTSDTLSITISNGYSAGGTLTDGNIRIQ
jgi:WD40 repeat protein